MNWMQFDGASCFSMLRRFSFLSKQKLGTPVGMVLDGLSVWWVWFSPCLPTCAAAPPNPANGSTD